MSPHTVAAQPPVAATPIPQVTVENHDDKAWRDTLLKVAAILCERQPESPQGYRLRRHALWQTITSTPQAESDGRTPLAAFPVDMMDDYLARLNNADMALWQQVEKACCWPRTGWTVITSQHRPRCASVINRWRMLSVMKLPIFWPACPH